MDTLIDRLKLALDARADLLDGESGTAQRLFAGFYEGCPDLVVDLYSSTLVLFDYSESLDVGEQALDVAQDYLLERFSWVNCVIWKRRAARDHDLRRGKAAYPQYSRSWVDDPGCKLLPRYPRFAQMAA